MATREVILTNDQIRLIRQWANNAWHDADQARLLTVPGSPQEAALMADQLDVEKIMEKLRKTV